MKRLAPGLIAALLLAGVSASYARETHRKKPHRGKPAVAAPAEAPIDMRVMTFNLMCDFCDKGGTKGTFDERLALVADTINRHDPDLISLQELRTRGQVESLLARLKEKYTPIFAGGFLASYPDPTLFVRASRFTVETKDGFWLGPSSPWFGFGWKTSFPRRVEYAELLDGKSGGHFVFAGTHFDNNPRNRDPSAELVVKKFAASGTPVIFAGDTNLRPDRPGYAALSSAFRDAFVEAKTYSYVANGSMIPTDGCNLEKASTFPECRVDHVFLSRSAPWRVRRWAVDTFRYPQSNGFISDHRAVIVELSR
ncbi:MAG: endonuclease/exonuclease/phosphatase family protein [Bdellovibrionales bacterium]|nr:endonuclease/exonuclease/phosphatase family protein [Bdellovibrionales bacterium]